MKTKTQFHKLTAWLLTLAMLMTFMPSMTFTAFAEDGTLEIYYHNKTEYPSVRIAYLVGELGVDPTQFVPMENIGDYEGYPVLKAEVPYNVNLLWFVYSNKSHEDFDEAGESGLIEEGFRSGICYTGESEVEMCDISGFFETSATYTVTIADTTNGTVTADVTEAPSGDTVTLTVTPASGFEIDTVSYNDGTNDVAITATEGVYSFEMPASDVTVTATFKEIISYKIWVGGVGMADGEYLANGANMATTEKPDDGYAYWKDNTLTLHNYTYTGIGYNDKINSGSSKKRVIIYVYKLDDNADEMSLILEGDNVLAVDTTEADSLEAEVDGIRLVTAGLTVSGSGSLTISDPIDGIWVSRNLTITDGNITVLNAQDDGISANLDVILTNGTVNLTAKHGIWSSGAIQLNGGKLNIHGTANGIYSDTYPDTMITVNGGVHTIVGDEYGISIPNDGNSLNINGGRLELISANTDAENDAAYYALKTGTFSIAGGVKVQASTEADGELGEFETENLTDYDYILFEEPHSHPICGETAYSYLKYIDQNLRERIAGSDQEVAAAEYIFEQLESFGYAPEYQSFNYSIGSKTINSQNIIVTKPGKSEETIIVGAHYDSVGTAGVDDNGSGVSVVLETVKSLYNVETPYTIKFIFFGAEEQGLRGSKAYVSNMTQEDIKKTICMINIDSVLAGTYRYMYSGDATSDVNGEVIVEKSWPFYQAMAISDEFNLGMRSNDTELNYDYPSPTTGTWSDHQSFRDKGIPYLYFEAANWELPDDPNYPEWGSSGAYETETGEVMHVKGRDDLTFIENEWGSRGKDTLTAYCKLLSELLVRIVPGSTAPYTLLNVVGEYEDESELESEYDGGYVHVDVNETVTVYYEGPGGAIGVFDKNGEIVSSETVSAADGKYKTTFTVGTTGLHTFSICYDHNGQWIDTQMEAKLICGDIVYISFSAYPATNPESQTLLPGEKVTKPDDPVREGYGLNHWCTKYGCSNGADCEDAWDFDNYIVTVSDTLYAVWERTHWEVYLDPQDGDCDIEYAYADMGTGKLASLPEATRVGYIFNGWFDAIEGGNKITTETEFSSNTTIYAQWTVNSYKFITIVDGEETEVTYEYGAAIETPADPAKTGYTFAGWSPAIPATMPANNVTVTAQWTEKQTVTIDEDTQTFTYDKEEKAFDISGTTLTGFTVTYQQNGQVVTPKNAGNYDVVITRNEDDVYKAFEKNLEDALIIEKAQAVITVVNTPIVKTYGETFELPTAETNFGTVSVDKTIADLKNVDTYTVTYSVVGTDNYKGDTKTVTVTVNPLPVNITWENTENLVYDGTVKTINAVLANKVSGDNVNLTVTGTTSAMEKGEYTATVTAVDNSNYTVTYGINLTKSWAISETTNEWKEALSITGWTYGESANAPTAEAKFGEIVYTYADRVDGAYTSDVPTSAGTWYVKATVEGATSYAEISDTKEFVISEKELNADNITAIADVTFTSEEIKPVIEVKDGDTVLELGTDYDVVYQDNTNVGTAKAIVTFKGNYKGNAEKEFTILKKQIDTAISLTAPVKNTAPQTEITGTGYTATVVWSPEVTDRFGYNTEYTATITITVDENHTVTGIAANGYTVEGAKTVTNEESSNVIKAVYEKTGSRPSSGGGTTRYTVKFDTDGGSSVASKTVTRNSKVAEPTAPTKDGYKFDGWYTDKELTTAYDFETKVTKSFTLYAKWTEDKADDTDDKTDTPDTPVWENPFTDVESDDWFYGDVEYAVENGLFNGTTTTTFAPNGIITRAMMVTVLYRAEGEPEVTGETTFEDVDENAYYAKAVVWGQQNGIIKGYSETEFAPNDNITREQIAAIMHRYAEYKGYDVSVGENTNILSYDDFADISEYAIPSMQYACGSGLMKGKTTSTLNPKHNATRAEIAAILHRFIEANK